MRLIIKGILFLSIVVIVGVSYKLLNVYTSLKYEIEEPLAMGKRIAELSKGKEEVLKDLIFWLWVTMFLQIINISILSKILTKSK